MDLIWPRSAWNAKPAAFSTYPPLSFLPPSFFLLLVRGCVAALEKREEIVREKRRRREKYKEEGKRLDIYTEKREDRRVPVVEGSLLSCYCFIFYSMSACKPVCVKRPRVYVFAWVSVCVEGKGTEEERQRVRVRWSEGKRDLWRASTAAT